MFVIFKTLFLHSTRIIYPGQNKLLSSHRVVTGEAFPMSKTRRRHVGTLVFTICAVRILFITFQVSLSPTLLQASQLQLWFISFLLHTHYKVAQPEKNI